MIKNTRTGYMCGIDFQHELGEIHSVIYPSLNSAKMAHPCYRECGIVKVVIKITDWMIDQNFSKPKRKKKR